MPAKTPRKILIVDDMNDNRLLLRIMLEREGWLVIETHDGCHVLRTALHEQPDVILMDYNMPFTNGANACREVKNTPATAHIPVLIYSGLSTSDIRQQAFFAGAADFLVKPLLPAQLRHALFQIIKQRNKGEEMTTVA